MYFYIMDRDYERLYKKYKLKYLNLLVQKGGGIKWLENDRGNSNDGKYPPCYNICGATKAIYDILEKNSLLEKYKLLLDFYSVVLCQEVYLKKKSCEKTMLDERYDEIKKLLGDKKIEKRHLEIVKNNINKNPEHKKMLEFLNMITVLIEEKISELNLEEINKKDLDKINRMNTVFYNVHYPVVSEKC